MTRLPGEATYRPTPGGSPACPVRYPISDAATIAGARRRKCFRGAAVCGMVPPRFNAKRWMAIEHVQLRARIADRHLDRDVCRSPPCSPPEAGRRAAAATGAGRPARSPSADPCRSRCASSCGRSASRNGEEGRPRRCRSALASAAAFQCPGGAGRWDRASSTGFFGSPAIFRTMIQPASGSNPAMLDGVAHDHSGGLRDLDRLPPARSASRAAHDWAGLVIILFMLMFSVIHWLPPLWLRGPQSKLDDR